MNLMSKEAFAAAWAELDKTSDPKAIHEAFEQDQEAEDEKRIRPTYRVTGDGELKQEDAA